MARAADHVITCSRYMRSHVATVFGVPRKRITAMQNGIDVDDLEPVADDLQALRAKYAKPGEQLVLLVGRLVYEKGFHLALDALAPVIKQRRNVRFVVAGTGTAEAELRTQARRLGLQRRGAFLGWVGDDMLHSLYRVSDLCIVPSIYEPFGIVALEAMASGCLCVVADTGGLREVVPGDGTVGLRFPSRDTAALQEIVERVLSDDALRAQLVAEAREHVLRFDWAQVARETLDALQALAGGDGPRHPAAAVLRRPARLLAGERHEAVCVELRAAGQPDRLGELDRGLVGRPRPDDERAPGQMATSGRHRRPHRLRRDSPPPCLGREPVVHVPVQIALELDRPDAGDARQAPVGFDDPVADPVTAPAAIDVRTAARLCGPSAAPTDCGG